MKKETQKQLLMSLVLIALISLTLWLWFDSFSFQTYTKILDEQLCFYFKDEELKIDGFELYHKNEIIQAGGARIEGLEVLKNDQLYIECQIKTKKDIVLKYEVKIEKDDQVIYLDHQNIRLSDLKDVQSMKMKILNKRKKKEIYKNEILLKQSQLKTYTGSNKDYSLSNAYLGDHWFKGGYFHCIDENFYQEYPKMIIDYMYLKENGDVENLDDYQRFMHLENQTKKFLDGYNDVYFDEDDELKNKDICAIITLVGEKEFVFRIDLKPTISEGEQ